MGTIEVWTLYVHIKSFIDTVSKNDPIYLEPSSRKIPHTLYTVRLMGWGTMSAPVDTVLEKSIFRRRCLRYSSCNARSSNDTYMTWDSSLMSHVPKVVESWHTVSPIIFWDIFYLVGVHVILVNSHTTSRSVYQVFDWHLTNFHI